MEIAEDMELVGRCPSMVTISGAQTTPYLSVPVVVLVDGTQDVTIRAVRISGDGIGILAANATVMVQGAHLHETTGVGIYAAQPGAQVSVERTLISNTLFATRDANVKQLLAIAA